MKREKRVYNYKIRRALPYKQASPKSRKRRMNGYELKGRVSAGEGRGTGGHGSCLLLYCYTARKDRMTRHDDRAMAMGMIFDNSPRSMPTCHAMHERILLGMYTRARQSWPRLDLLAYQSMSRSSRNCRQKRCSETRGHYAGLRGQEAGLQHSKLGHCFPALDEESHVERRSFFHAPYVVVRQRGQDIRLSVAGKAT